MIVQITKDQIRCSLLAAPYVNMCSFTDFSLESMYSTVWLRHESRKNRHVTKNRRSNHLLTLKILALEGLLRTLVLEQVWLGRAQPSPWRHHLPLE